MKELNHGRDCGHSAQLGPYNPIFSCTMYRTIHWRRMHQILYVNDHNLTRVFELIFSRFNESVWHPKLMIDSFNIYWHNASKKTGLWDGWIQFLFKVFES